MRAGPEMRRRLEAYLAAWAKRPDVAVTGLERLANGWETDIYGFTAAGASFGAGRALVLRRYHGEAAAPRAAAEGHVMQGLRAQDYPVPEVLAWDLDRERFGGPFLVMERVDGRPLWEAAPDREAMVRRFCALMVRLHRVDPAPFVRAGTPWPTAAAAAGTFTLPFLQEMLGRSGLTEALAPLTERLAAWEPSVGRAARSLIHGDLHPENILVTVAGDPYVIDWGTAAVDDPRVDVAQAMALAITGGNPELAQAVRKGYEAAAGVSLRDLDYFLLLALTRRLATALIVLVRGAEALGLRPGLEAELWQQRGMVQQMADFVAQTAGVALPGIQRVLTAD